MCLNHMIHLYTRHYNRLCLVLTWRFGVRSDTMLMTTNANTNTKYQYQYGFQLHGTAVVHFCDDFLGIDSDFNVEQIIYMSFIVEIVELSSELGMTNFVYISMGQLFDILGVLVQNGHFLFISVDVHAIQSLPSIWHLL